MTRPPWPTVRRTALIALGFAVVLGTHAAILCSFAKWGRMNADEGYYAIAARSAVEGRIPYRDFVYTQMPLLPYLNGAVMAFTGFGLTAQRVVNSVWSMVAVLAVVLALRLRTGSFEPGLAAAFSIAASPHLAEMTAMGKTHGAELMGTALLALAALARLSPLRKAAVMSACGVLAAGVRLTCAPLWAVVGLVPVLEARSWRERLLALAIPLAAALAVLGPFALLAPEQAYYCNWQYHMASVFQRRSVAQLLEWWHTSPGAILLLVAGLPAIPALIRRRQHGPALLLLAALIGLTLPMIPHSAYGMYVIPAIPLAAVAGMAALWSHEGIRRNPFRHVVWLLPALVLYHPLPKFNTHPTAESVEAAAAFLREKVPPGPVLASLPIVAVEAGREVMPGTEMGMFAAMSPEDRKRARRLHLTTLADLTRMVEDRVPEAVVLMSGDNVWNFKWRVPTLRRQPRSIHARFRKAVLANYEVAFRSRSIEVRLPVSD